MVDLNSYKKAELLSAAHKVGLSAGSKDTKKSLIEKFQDFISQAGKDGESLVEASLEDETVDDDDTSTLAESIKETIDDEDDEEYKGPPLNVKKLLDPIIDFGEEYYSKFLEFTDSVGITTLEYNDELRENLSTTITLSYIELILEFGVFISTYVPMVSVKHNNTIHPILKDLIPVLSTCTCKIPDLTSLLDFKILSVAVNWVFYSIMLPLLFSYYVNFTRRIIVTDEDTSLLVRIHKYDPFIFALFKVLIFYILSMNAGNLVTLNSYSGIFKALQTHFLIQLGFYNEFVGVLGNMPFVLGVVNVVIGLYAQFEEY